MNSYENLERSVQCVICYNPMTVVNTPLMLNCGHVFCSRCIDEVKTTERGVRIKVVCPSCRLPGRYSGMPPIQYTVQAIAELVVENIDVWKQNKICMSCSGEMASLNREAHCSDCHSKTVNSLGEALEQVNLCKEEIKKVEVRAIDAERIARINQASSMKGKEELVRYKRWFEESVKASFSFNSYMSEVAAKHHLSVPQPLPSIFVEQDSCAKDTRLGLFDDGKLYPWLSNKVGGMFGSPSSSSTEPSSCWVKGSSGWVCKRKTGETTDCSITKKSCVHID